MSTTKIGPKTKNALYLLLAFLMGNGSGAYLPEALAPTKDQVYETTAGLQENTQLDLLELDEDSQAAKYIYDLWCNCEYTTTKEIGGDGLPNYTIEDDKSVVTRKVLQTAARPHQVTSEYLTKVKFCGAEGEAGQILNLRLIRRIYGEAPADELEPLPAEKE